MTLCISRIGNAPRLLPAEDYVSGNHRSHRANARVLRLLDDETGIDLATKRRLLAGIAHPNHREMLERAYHDRFGKMIWPVRPPQSIH